MTEGQRYTFALCTETPLVRPGELLDLAVPLERNAQDCAKAWGLPAPAVVIANSYRELPPHCRPIVFVDGEADPGVLAVHYWDPVRNGPAGRVYVDHTSGMITGPYSVCESAAHEVLEALVDATVDQWRQHPMLSDGIEVALEDCDPCQDTYEILHAGTSWPVANFVTPAWFDSRFADVFERQKFLQAGGKFDHMGRLNMPGELGPDGYMVLRQRVNGEWRYWNEWPAMRLATTVTRAAALDHAWSRTKHRLAGCPTVHRPTIPAPAP